MATPGKVEVIEALKPVIRNSTDAIVRVTSTAICESNLHLYGVFDPHMDKNDVLGHEFMGIVEEAGSDVTNLQMGGGPRGGSL